jgi:hypothetical protein
MDSRTPSRQKEAKEVMKRRAGSGKGRKGKKGRSFRLPPPKKMELDPRIALIDDWCTWEGR